MKKFLTLLTLLFLVFTFTARAQYNANANFSITDGNPNGVWTYGKGATNADFTTFPTPATVAGGVISWNNGFHGFHKNTNNTPYQNIGVVWNPGKLIMHPNNNGETFAKLKFTPPGCGSYAIQASWKNIDLQAKKTNPRVVIHRASGVEVVHDITLTNAGANNSYSGNVSLVVGEYLTFEVGNAGDTNADDSVEVEVTINFTPATVVNQDFNATICQGSSYLFENASYTQSGTYIVNLTNASGCPYTKTLRLTVTPAPDAPATACYETATFNSATCQYDITGTQPPAPTGLACYQTATFNSTTCQYDITGTQPIAPAVACYETATFNGTTCQYDITGTQPPAPTGLACYQTATFDTATCSWVVAVGQNNALDFDGVDDFIALATTPNTTQYPKGNQSRTVETWFKLPDLTNSYTIFGQGDHETGKQFAIKMLGDGRIFFHGHYNDAEAYWTQDLNWNHLAITYDNTLSSGNMKIYLNGNLIGQGQVAFNDDVNDDTLNGISIGTYLDLNFAAPYKGQLDNFRIWDKALSQSEINDSRNNEYTTGKPNLVLQLNFNEGSAQGNNIGITSCTNTGSNGASNSLNNFTLTGNSSNFVTGFRGLQPVQPDIACYQTATFNAMSCSWDISGEQPTAPTGLACYETATFNGTTCQYDISGTMPVAPTGLACYETATFNSTSCQYDITGTQPVAPAVACYETATFNSTTCQYDISGTQPPAPTGLACYQTATFNSTSCQYDISGTQPAAPNGLSCDQTVNFDPALCTWTITTPQQGAALQFDGTNDYVSLPLFNFSGNNKLTIEAWVKPTSITANPYYEISRQQISPASADADWLFSFQDHGTILSFGLSTTTGYSELDLPISAASFTDGNWHHVAAVYDGSTRKIYKDGVLLGGDAKTGNIRFTPNGTTNNIGAFNNGGENYHGSIDEVRFWNRALSVTELNNNKNCELGGTPAGLYAYYKCNAGMAGQQNALLNTLTDSSGNNRSGTLVNFALSGTASNWMPGAVATTAHTRNATALASFTWRAPLGNGQTYTTNQTGLTHVSTTAAGCTHTETLNLTIIPIPTLACYQTAVPNTASCQYDITGTQPPAPTGLACYETATFNNSSCAWEVTGTQPVQPVLVCNQTAVFNNSRCTWVVTTTPTTIGSATITASGLYTWPLPYGTGLSYTASGTYTNTTTDASGCQNVATLVLTIPVTTVNTFNLGTSCGATVSSLAVTIIATPVPGAPSYVFRLTNTATGAVQLINRPVNSFALSNYPGITLGTLYRVEVSVNNGLNYGTPCFVNTPAPVCNIAVQCGTILNAMDEFVYCNYVPSVTMYRFRVTNMTDNSVQEIESPVYRFRFSQLPVRAFGTTYFIEVALRNTDGTYLPYNAGCSLNTPAFPTTSIQASQCGSTQAGTKTNLLANLMNGATAYRFQLSGVAPAYNHVVERPLHYVSLSMFPGLQSGTTYTVKVAVKIGGIWGPYGTACSISLGGSATAVTKTIAATPFQAQAYPNPFTDSFALVVTTTATTAINIRVFDMLGREIESATVTAAEMAHLNLGDNYPSGVYTVLLSQDGDVAQLRVVKR